MKRRYQNKSYFDLLTPEQRQQLRQVDYYRERERQRMEENPYARERLQVVNQFNKLIEFCYDDIQKELSYWYNRFASEQGLTLPEAKKLVQTADIDRLARDAEMYSKYRDNVSFAFSEKANLDMEKYNRIMKLSRLELMARRLELALAPYADLGGEILGKHVTDMTLEELEYQSSILGQGVQTPEQIRRKVMAIAEQGYKATNFSKLLWEHTDAFKDRLMQGLTKSLVQGVNPRTWHKKLLPDLIVDNKEYAKFAAYRLAVSEANIARKTAQKDALELAGYDSYEIIVESGACETCEKHKGKIRPLKNFDMGVNAPQFHPFCRCSFIGRISPERLKESDERIKQLNKEYFEQHGHK